MASLSKLGSLLRDLSDHVPSATRGESKLVNNGTDVKSLAKDISDLVMSGIEDQDQDYASSLLFHSENSILRFLRTNIRTKDTNIMFAQSELLHFIASYIQKVQRVLEPYSLGIREACFVLACGAGARVRNAAIDTLTVMVDTGRSKLEPNEFDIQQLYDQFSRSFTLAVSKTPMSTKGCILEFLGTVAKLYPEIADAPRVMQLQRWCLTTLENQLFVEGQADNSIVAGAISSLDGLVCSPHSTMTPDSKEIGTLYKVIKRLMDLPENLSRYAAPLAALSFFSNHTDLLDTFIIEDCGYLYDHIQAFCMHKNRDLSKLGFKTMNNLMKMVSRALSSRPKGQAEIQAFNLFLKRFISCLQTDIADLNVYDLSLTIRGLGYFSLACKKYMKPDEFDMLKDKLIGMNAWFYSEFNSEDGGDHTGEIPSFIQAYAQFANSLDTIPPSLMNTINSIVDIFTLRYGQLPSSVRVAGVYGVQNLLRTLFRKGEGTLRNFIKEFFYNALRYTCSSARTNENEERLVYMEFVYFWDTILCDKNGSSGKDDKKATENQKRLQTILYDEFFAAFLRIVKSFNLDVERIEEKEEENTENTNDDTLTKSPDLDIATAYGNLRPQNRTDFNLFYNMTQFWCVLLPKLPNDRLRDWMHISGSTLVELSLRRPLVSGFYKMISVMLMIANKNQLFNHFKTIYQKQQQQHKRFGSIHLLPEVQADLFSAFTLFRDYLRQSSQRLQQFKDELLSSCLQAVLAYPLAFFEIRELIPPLQTAFRLGLTFYPLAVTALDVLDILVDPNSDAPKDLTYLEYIIPLMNEYLMMDLRAKANPHRSKTGKVMSLAQLKRQEIHYQLTADVLGVTTQEEVNLRDIQLRMMCFLGRIGGINKLMIKTQMAEKVKYLEQCASSQQIVAWDPDRKLKFNLPFPNARIELNLDEILPRICELSELAPDRQVKVAACELLHGIVIMMIGNSAFEGRATREATESRYIKLYTRIFPVLLRLAVDIDQVARTMFRSLNAQLIHWLTNNAQYENSETICLLTTCLNAACGTDSGLRDYAADCVREFVRWSLKQVTDESSPMNIRSLLKRLYLLLSNPSARQRLGACMIFNRIYREYGKRDELIDEYLLEIFYHLFFCLKLGEDDHPLVGTREQAQEAIAHLRRILRKRTHMFFEEKSSRRKVPGLEKTDLSSFISWSIHQVGQLQREYAKQCMEFFAEFVRHLPGIKNGRDWMKKTLEKDPNYLMQTFEPSRLDPSQIRKPGSALLWLKQLNCTLDAYVWLVEHDIVDSIQLLENKRSVFLSTCKFFLENSIMDLLQKQGSESRLEESRGNAIYAYVSYQLLRFLTLGIRSRDCDKVITVIERSGILLSQQFVTSVSQMLLLPSQYYDAVQVEQHTLSTWLSEDKVRQAARAFVQSMLELGPPRFIRLFSKASAAIIYAEGISLANLELNQGSLSDMLQTIEGIKIFQDLKMLDLICRSAPASSGNRPSALDYCESLFGKFMEFRDTYEPANINLLGEMLKIAFNLKGFAAEHAEELLLKSDDKLTDRTKTYQKFSGFINDCYATNFKVFAPLFVANIEDEFVQQAIIGLLKHLAEGRMSHRREVITFMNDLSSGTTFLKDLIAAWSDPSRLDAANIFRLLRGSLYVLRQRYTFVY
ncbi:hypothetical protein BX666DRAFT_1633731 [Dichotomocladium elegans]|nr:hypothetical protein BX666DRAFT_1633731 [Dichotomocladium elegans]